PATALVSTVYDNSALSCTVTGPAATHTSPIPFTITFSEPVALLDVSALTVTNSTNVTLSGAGAVYTALVTPAAQGSVTCAAPAGAAFNAVWSPNGASNTATSTYDTTPPNTSI